MGACCSIAAGRGATAPERRVAGANEAAPAGSDAARPPHVATPPVAAGLRTPAPRGASARPGRGGSSLERILAAAEAGGLGVAKRPLGGDRLPAIPAMGWASLGA